MLDIIIKVHKNQLFPLEFWQLISFLLIPLTQGFSKGRYTEKIFAKDKDICFANIYIDIQRTLKTQQLEIK